MGTIKDFKYKLIKNFLTKEEVKLLTDYCRIKHRLNFDSFEFVQGDNGDTCFYGDPLMESLMVNKLELMQKETGLELLPTYAFWRMYTMHADLKKHKTFQAVSTWITRRYINFLRTFSVHGQIFTRYRWEHGAF